MQKITKMLTEPKNVVMFQRRLTRSIAGGARSVFDRGSFLQEMGYKVTFFIMDKSSAHGRAISDLRRDGILHPENEIVFVQDILETHADRVRALSVPSLMPKIPAAAHKSIVESKGRVVGADYYVEDIVRCRVNLFRDGQIRRQEVYDDQGRIEEAWIHDHTGSLLYIDEFDPQNSSLTTRKLVSQGRMAFCEIDMNVPLGLGLVSRESFEQETFAGFVARRIAEYLEPNKAIVIADGENISQNILRALPQNCICCGISVLHNNHTDFPHTKDAPIRNAWSPFLTNTNNVSNVVCLTDRQMGDLKQIFPKMPLCKINHPMPSVPNLEIARDLSKVVFVGRLSHQKRLDHLINVIELINQSLPDVRFEIFGEGDKREWVAELIQEKGLSQFVKLNGFTSEPLKVFASGALTIMTSYYEGLPLTLLEAMSVGTPFVAYDLNYGPAEIIQTDENGILVENGDEKAAATAVINLLSDTDRLRKLSIAAIETAQKYTVSEYQHAWGELIEKSLREVV